MHLAALIDAIHEVHSDSIAPYLEHNRHKICETCAFLHSSICPCPMDYLSVLLVQAVEAVDQRLEWRAKGRQIVSALPASDQAGLEEIVRAYQEATGTWTGCDWPTRFGETNLDLNGRTVTEAEVRERTTTGNEAQDWHSAALWLWLVEMHAAQAEKHALLALEAANAGDLPKALDQAHRAWSLEFVTGRHLRRGFPGTWQPLCRVVEAALGARAEEVAAVTVE
jgi:hypothetical protein